MSIWATQPSPLLAVVSKSLKVRPPTIANEDQDGGWFRTVFRFRRHMLRKDKKEVVEEEGEIVTRCWWWWYCWPSLLTMSVSTHLSFSPLSFVVPRVPYYRVRRKEREMIRLSRRRPVRVVECWYEFRLLVLPLLFSSEWVSPLTKKRSVAFVYVAHSSWFVFNSY